ncbi:MAG: tetratricopeptide repeat protein, partial [Acidobacteriota bacterium]
MQKMLSTLLTLLLASTAAFAQSERNQEREKTYWQQLEKIAPKAVENFKAATKAWDAKDNAKAAQLFGEVIKQAPDYDVAIRRLGMTYVELGRYDEGKALVTRVYEKNPSPDNSIAMARVLIFQGPGKSPTQQHKERALTLMVNAVKNANDDDPSDAFFTAQVAADLNKTKEFLEIQSMLSKKFPNRWETHYFNGVAAATLENWSQAEEEIKRAESLGMPAEAAAEVLASFR